MLKSVTNVFSRLVSSLCAAAVVLLLTGVGSAADLSDQLDNGDGFSLNDTLKGKTNTKFHQAKGRGKIKNPGANDVIIDGSNGDVNFGSVVDSEVRGDVIIIMDDVDATIK